MPTREALTILVVEDNDDAVRLLEVSLWQQKRARVSVVRAESLASALTLLEGQTFDAALVDLGLPDTSGISVVGAIRRKALDLPLVVLTGSGEELAVDALRAGAQDYLSKGDLSGPAIVRSLLFAIERGRNERRLADLAYRDQLTGLANRPATTEALTAALKELDDGGWVAVVFLDVNRFKSINDTFGHNAGDEVLKEVGRRLSSVTRQQETVGRWAGDEFLVLAAGGGEEGAGERLAQRLEVALTNPPILDPSGAAVTVSLGMAVARDPKTGVEELVGRADASMYAAKAGGPAKR